MIFHLQPVHVQLDSGFEQLAEKKFSRLERFFPGEPEVHLLIKKEKFEFIIEVKIRYRKKVTFMKTSSNNLNIGLDDIINKMKNHLSKLHDKKHNKKNRKSEEIAFFSSTVHTETEEEST
ncbi:MAG TPA: HPF/RaiA family ribosome-associated protein [bacterium]|nr:HPF/RaiA family ribosome-associated protein [bacterium]HOL35754.1 HPF/RaiA family ribosome-associated protein [bacterium]HPP07837.1 HPF/RaiA family ribosome-associated protein [bacterium]